MHPFDEPTKAPAVDHDQIVSPEPNPDAAELIENAMDAASAANEREDDTDRPFVLEAGGQQRIAAVRDRLFTENRLNADDMRDLAETLRLALESGMFLSSWDVDRLIATADECNAFCAVHDADCDGHCTHNFENHHNGCIAPPRLPSSPVHMVREHSRDELYAIGARHGKTPAEVDAFLAKK
jgi:hypothetical protein